MSIIEILQAHRLGSAQYDPFRSRDILSCFGCDKFFRDQGHHEAHIATLIAEDLRLDIEKTSEAICNSRLDKWDSWHVTSESDREGFRRMARAAIASW